MAIKRFVISDESPVTLQKGDLVVETYPGEQVVIERDVPDAPEYHVGVVGNATIENKFGVLVPNVHGVWVETAKKLYFRAFVAKNVEQAVFPERRVVIFKPDLTPEESTLEIRQALAQAEDQASRAERSLQSARAALTAVGADLHLLRTARDPLAVEMVTSQGATIQRHLADNWVSRTELADA